MDLFIYFQKDGKRFRKRVQESAAPGESALFIYLLIYFVSHLEDSLGEGYKSQQYPVSLFSFFFIIFIYFLLVITIQTFYVWVSDNFYVLSFLQKSTTVQNLRNVKPHPPAPLPPPPHRGFPVWSPIAIPHLGRRRRRSPSPNLPHREEISSSLDTEIVGLSLLPGPTCTNIVGKSTPCVGTG